MNTTFNVATNRRVDLNLMQEDVHLVVAGAGLVGKRHVEAIDHTKGTILSGIVELSEEGVVYASSLGVPCFNSLNEMFQNLSPDGIILATPTPLHVEQGLVCIENGCPVLIEKPLGASASDAEVLVETADARGVPLLVGHHRRHNPLVRKAKEIIENGDIGEIRAVHSNCWFFKPDDYFETAPWRKLIGAGPISVNLVHDVDLIRYLCGEVVSVQAQSAPSSRGYENEDVAAAVLRFDNGVIGTITVSDSIVSPWSWELTAHEHPVYPKTAENAYMIGGSRGSLSVPDLKVWTHKDSPDWWSPISSTTSPWQTSDPLLNQILHFSNVIRGQEPPLVSGREGLKSLRVVEAIQLAAESGETVRLTND